MDEFVSSSEPTHSIIVFYGIKDDNATCERFFFSSVEWMKRVGAEPNRVGYLNLAAPDKNLHNFAAWIAQTPKPDFTTIAAFELHTFQSRGRSGWADPLVSADFSRYEFSGMYAYRLARSTVTQLGQSRFDYIDKEMLDILDPDYGIGYTMPVAHGPAMYAIGTSVGRADSNTSEGRERSIRVANWADFGMANHVYRRGLLRGVYPRNYLAPVQLDQQVGTLRLSEWIVKDKARGDLIDFGRRLKLWTVPEVNITAIEAEL